MARRMERKMSEELKAAQESVESEVQETPQLFFSFSGRARRSTWWNASIGIYILIGIITSFILMAIFGSWERICESGLLGISGLVSSLILLPLYVRRLHDCNISGWWMVLHFCIVIPWTNMLNLGGLKSGNDSWIVIISFIIVIISGIELVVLGCLDGTPGPNRYGPDPKGRAPLPSPFAAPVQTVNVAPPEERIKKLKELKDAGIITESEYDEKRTKLLSEI